MTFFTLSLLQEHELNARAVSTAQGTFFFTIAILMPEVSNHLSIVVIIIPLNLEITIKTGSNKELRIPFLILYSESLVPIIVYLTGLPHLKDV